MGASKIEQLIEDIYEFVESCRMQPLSSTKVIVPKDELYDLLDELRLRTPDEIKRYQKIISNRDAIIADAEEKAVSIIAGARENASGLVNDHEIMQQAYYQANELINQANAEAERIIAAANQDAEQIRGGAFAYTNDMLSEVENILTNAYESSRAKYDGLMQALKGNLDIVVNNRRELYEDATSMEEVANSVSDTLEEETDDKEDYNFDENTFLEDIEP